METKPHKKGKKRPIKEAFLSSKSDQKSKNIVEIKKKFKKDKIDDTVQNGEPITEIKAVKKVNKQQVRQKKFKEQNDKKLLEAKVTANITKETKSIDIESKKKSKEKSKKLEHLKNKQLTREMNKIVPKTARQYKTKAPLDLDQLKSKLAEIRSREVLTKTAKKKICMLKRKIRVIEEQDISKKSDTVEKDNEKNKHQAKMSVKNKEKANVKIERKGKKEHGKDKKAKIEIEQDIQSDDESDDEYCVAEEEEKAMDLTQGKVATKRVENEKDDSDQDEDDSDQEEDDSDQEEDDSDQEEEDSDQEEEDNDQEEDDSDQEEDDSDQEEDDSDQEENDSDQEEDGTVITERLDEEKKKKSLDVLKKKDTVDKQYVLFVRNLPFDLTTDELKQHFLTKVDTVMSVRIPIDPKTKKSRGFGYVEFSNSTDYEEGLSLNNTFLKKRKIHVQYSTPKNANKVVVAKTKKLEALHKIGKLADVKGKNKFSKKGRQNPVGSKA